MTYSMKHASTVGKSFYSCMVEGFATYKLTFLIFFLLYQEAN
jgi:hypothetical protein